MTLILITSHEEGNQSLNKIYIDLLYWKNENKNADKFGEDLEELMGSSYIVVAVLISKKHCGKQLSSKVKGLASL